MTSAPHGSYLVIIGWSCEVSINTEAITSEKGLKTMY